MNRTDGTPKQDGKDMQALLKALQALSAEHGLGIDSEALARAEQPHPQDAAFYLQALFPHRTASHAEELGEAPSSAYPRLLTAYAAASAGALAPQDIEADSDDGWTTLSLEFRHAGKTQRFKVKGVEDSDWFAPDFVNALNRFAKRAGLPGRWVDFHNGEDACTSIYVPEAAHSRFKTLKKKYSARTDEDETGSTPELLAYAESKSIASPPAIEVQLDKAQLAQRKAEWPEFEARLRVFHSKSEVKMLERYFLSGKEPKWDLHWEEDPIPLIYRLWLFPDRSDAAWCAVTERVLAYKDGNGIGRSLMDSATILRRADSSAWNGRDNPAGCFAGDEKRLLAFLQGRSPGSAHFSYRGAPLYTNTVVLNRQDWEALGQWLADKPPYNPFPLFRYQAEGWLASIHDESVQKMDKEIRQGMWRAHTFFKVLAVIAHYPAPVEGEADERREYCQMIRENLDSRALPVPFDAWWAQAKEASG